MLAVQRDRIGPGHFGKRDMRDGAIMSNQSASAFLLLGGTRNPGYSSRRRLAVCILFAATGLLMPCHAAGQTTTSAEPAMPSDPKMTSILVKLRQAVDQRRSVDMATNRSAAPASFSISDLPRSLRDAIQAHTMHLSARAEVQAEIQMSSLVPESLATLEQLGVTIEIQAGPDQAAGAARVFSRIPTVQAEVPVAVLQLVEDLPFVRFIRLPYYAMANGSLGASPGSLTTQGDTILHALALRTNLGVTGAGVRIGVLSTGIGGLFQAGGCTTTCAPIALSGTTASPILTGDLPGRSASFGTRSSNGDLTAVSTDFLAAARSFRSLDGDLGDTADGSEGAEGSAMLEIIHHLAPGAILSFANADTDLEFETAVNYLASQNDIVVDDMSFLAPSYDGTSDISQNTSEALNSPANPVRAYITVAGNYALNHYSGTWSDSGTDGFSATQEHGDLQTFSGVPVGTVIPTQGAVTQLSTATIDNLTLGKQTSDPLISLPAMATVQVGLSWNDRPGASSNDFDLFLVPVNCTTNAMVTQCALTGPPVQSSTNRQTGFQDPYEYLSYTTLGPGPQSLAVVIQNYNNLADTTAGASTFDMFIIGNGAKGAQPNHNFYTISGSIPAQADAGGGVITVGAINQAQCDATPNVTTADNCTQQLEPFTGQGPTQITPQVVTAATKPNLTAVDQVCITGAGSYGIPLPSAGVSCPVSGGYTYTPRLFGGTSAAAAHVAAIAALTLQMAPCLLTSFGSQTSSAASFARTTLYTALTGLPTVTTTSGNTSTTVSAVQYASPLSGYDITLPNTASTSYPYGVPNNAEGWGLVDAYSSAASLLPVPTAQNILATSTTQPDPNLIESLSATGFIMAINSNGAMATLTSPIKLTNLSACPVTNIEWGPQPNTTSTLTVASAQGPQATVAFPVGITPTVVAPSINYGITYPPFDIVTAANVVVTDFILSVQPSTPAPVTVPAGTPAVFIVTAASQPTGPFTNPVSLSCQLAGLPPGAMCVFSPSVVNPSIVSSSGVTQMATSTLTIYTSGVVGSLRPTTESTRARPLEAGLFYGSVLVLGVFALSRRSRRMLRKRVALASMAIGVCLGTVSCGKNSTPAINPITYTVTVVGTSSSLVRTAPLTLTIQ